MNFLRRTFDFFLPSSCCYCRSPIEGSGIARFCATCWSDFSLLAGPACPSCGKPFDSPESLVNSPHHLCHECRRLPPRYDEALSVGAFEGPLREAIHQYKYRPCRSLGKPLGEWMSRHVRILAKIDIVVPVPLHVKRLRQRGFNQALLLAHGMSLRHSLSLSYDNLVRVTNTRPQVDLSGEERKRNVKGAFVLRRPREILSKNVILVDDVLTTGATMNECASVLKEAGAERVTAFTLARAV